jgi:hypothetical protein
MAIQKIGGVDAAGAVALTTIGVVVPIADGENLRIDEVDVESDLETRLELHLSQVGTGFAAFTVEGAWTLPAKGSLGREYAKSPILDITGIGTPTTTSGIAVRLQFIQPVAARLSAFAIGELL